MSVRISGFHPRITGIVLLICTHYSILRNKICVKKITFFRILFHGQSQTNLKLGDMLPPLKSYDFEVGASCSITL